jgi:hypothetical protein
MFSAGFCVAEIYARIPQNWEPVLRSEYAQGSKCFTMRRIRGRGLSSGTVTERIAPESLTLTTPGFVHRNISR